MSWARLDDNFHDHPKVVGLDPAAVGVYVQCLTWAHRNTRHTPGPGLIPDSLPARFGGKRSKVLVATLVERGLWEKRDNGWYIHDFDEYLPDPKTREARSAAGSAGAAKRWGKKPATSQKVDSNQPSGSHDVAMDVAMDVATDLPSEPMANDGSRTDAHREVLRTSPGPTPVPVPSLTGHEDVPAMQESPQTLIAEWLGNCNDRPPKAVIGQVSKQIKGLLDEDIPYDQVRAGLGLWMTKGLHPSTLPSVVNEVMNARPAQTRVLDQFRPAMERAALRDERNLA
jgi:hypothetical protein